MSRAKSMRSSSSRARSVSYVAIREEEASATRLAEHPQQVALLLVDRRRAGGGLGEDDADPAARRDDRDVDERVVADELGEVVGDVVAVVREHLDDAVLGQRLARDRRRLDRDVPVGEVRERDPVRAGGVHAAARVVVAEDHRAVHLGEPADGLGEAREELVGAVLLVDAREDVAQQLERRDRVGARRCAAGMHAFIVTDERGGGVNDRRHPPAATVPGIARVPAR